MVADLAGLAGLGVKLTGLDVEVVVDDSSMMSIEISSTVSLMDTGVSVGAVIVSFLAGCLADPVLRLTAAGAGFLAPRVESPSIDLFSFIIYNYNI